MCGDDGEVVLVYMCVHYDTARHDTARETEPVLSSLLQIQFKNLF